MQIVIESSFVLVIMQQEGVEWYLSRTFRNLTGCGNFYDPSGTTFADRYVRRFCNDDFGKSFDQAAINR